MNIWNKDCRILDESNYNMNYLSIPQQFDLKFIESNLNFLNNVSSSQIIIDDYINQFNLPIQYIPYIISHLNKFIVECPINNLNNHCHTLINICDNIYDHQKFELFDLIFTKDFNKAFMERVIIILKNYELNEIQYFLFSTHIGTIITSWSALQALFDDYYNSQYLLEKL